LGEPVGAILVGQGGDIHAHSLPPQRPYRQIPSGAPTLHGGPVTRPFRLDEVSVEQAGRRAKRGYFVPGLIALVVLAAAGGVANFAGLNHAGPHRLAGPDVETFLAQAIQSSNGLSQPPSISCPPSEPVRAGFRFTCTWQRAGGNRPVSVTETDSRGQFRYSVSSSQG